jgi:hypothetical protein
MRLSEWRENAPLAEAASDAVMAVVEPLLVDLGAAADAECWVAWGEDPGMKYSILAPTLAGLITVVVRPLGSLEGPRAVAKLIRWSKLAVSELSIESAGGHRIVAVQVEAHVLKGVDDEADRICEFVRGLVAGVENRVPQLQPVVASGFVPVVAAPVSAGAATAAAGPSAAPGGAAVAGGRTKRAASGDVQKQSQPGEARKPRGSAAKKQAEAAEAPRPAPGEGGAPDRAAAGQRHEPADATSSAEPAASTAPAEGQVPPTMPTPVAPVPLHRVPHTAQPAAVRNAESPVVERSHPRPEEWTGPRPIEAQQPGHKKRRWMP